MKISKVAQLCKANRQIVLVNVDDGGRKPVQWVGTMDAVYQFQNMRTMDKAAIYTIFDVTEKQESKITFSELTPDKINFWLGEADDTEMMIEPRGVNIVYGGGVYVPFNTSKGIRLVDRAYITAMAKDIEMLSFYERQRVDGKIYIAARMGLLLAGVIAPRYNAGGDKHLAEFARFFSARMDVAQICAAAEQLAQTDRDDDVQLTLIHDDETGELLEDGTGDAPDEQEPDTEEDQSPAAVASFSAAQAEKTDKIVLKLRDDTDGGDAA